MTKDEFYSKWIAAFAGGVSDEDIQKYVVSSEEYNNFIWHVFSWKLVKRGSYLTGKAANKAYSRVDQAGAVFSRDEGKSFHAMNDCYASAPAEHESGEFYAVGKDFEWTYISTHECFCGPYFMVRPDKVGFNHRLALILDHAKHLASRACHRAIISPVRDLGSMFSRFLMKRKIARFIKMPSQKLASLSDQDLMLAVDNRINLRITDEYDPIASLGALNAAQKDYIVVHTFFYSASSHNAAPYLSECLGRVEAFEHKRVFDDFVRKYGIDVNDTSVFEVEDDWETHLKKREKYHLDEFEDAFYSLESIEKVLVRFIRSNISQM